MRESRTKSGTLFFWLLGLIGMLIMSPALALEQRLKVEGVWSNERLTVYRISQRDPSKDPRRIRVAGQISHIDRASRKLKIGPVWMGWRADQQAQFDNIAQGSAVEIDANLKGGLGSSPVFFVSRIKSSDLDSPDSVEIIGTVTGTQRYDLVNRIDLSGIPTWAPTRLYSNGRARTRRLGDRRPADQFTIQLGTAELVLGGEIEVSSKYEGNHNLDRDGNDDLLNVQEEVQLDAFLSVNDVVSAYVELKIELGQEFETSLNKVDDDSEFKRGQSWIYLDQPFDWPIGLQVGRQNFAESREWWWDDDLDAIRLFLGADNFRFDLGIAQEIGREDLRADHADPEEEDILRVLSSARWKMSSAAKANFFFLHHDDRSSSFSPGLIIADSREDEIDAQLDWFGARLTGEFDIGDTGEVEYWLDSAIVRGDETIYDFDGLDDSLSLVTSTVSRKRNGWALDVGSSIRFPSRFEPTLTVGYALDNGEFRQTGLDDNSDRFNGVTRFRYYGELVRPELSNIRITTLGFGLRFFDKSSLDLVHHTYRQRNASRDHSLRIDTDSNGLSGNLGAEFDLVAGFREWKHWDIEAVGSYFIPGDGFDSDDPAWIMALQMRYNY
jgi:alginate production protein